MIGGEISDGEDDDNEDNAEMNRRFRIEIVDPSPDAELSEYDYRFADRMIWREPVDSWNQ